MTSETRTLIELSDITGIEFECPDCHASTFYQLDNFKNQLRQDCPNCNKRWMGNEQDLVGSGVPTIAEQLVRFIASIRNIGNRQDLRARVKLHVNTVAGT